MLTTLRALFVTMAICWFCAAAASAAERGTAMRFDIPAQSLDGALNAFAEAAGVQLSYPGALSEGLRSPALSGRYTVDQALEQLLEGTAMTVPSPWSGMIPWRPWSPRRADPSTMPRRPSRRPRNPKRRPRKAKKAQRRCRR